MCGIFATTNDQDSAQTILEGLKLLEYRGYDSWGIAVKGKQKVLTQKKVGKISNSKTDLPKSKLGIGHTRWATHGKVSKTNAHPHVDCSGKLTLVHNGIVDNWQQLKDKLEAKHLINSQTDSEIVVHLIEQNLKKDKDLLKAVRKTVRQTKGINAFLVFHQDYPYLVAAKTGSPIVIGYNKGNHLVASDIASLLPQTNKIIHLKDDQIATISPNDVSIYDLHTGKKTEYKVETIDWKPQQAEKGEHKHFMIKEIYQQPQLIEKIIQDKLPSTQKLADQIKKADNVFAVACGTAAYAALAGQYFFSRIAKKQINPAIGSEFYYHSDFLNPDSLCIALSQSGETIDTIQSIRHANKKGSKTFSLINTKGSTLDRISDESIFLEAGPEKAVASTKAFTAKLSLLLMAAYQYTGESKKAKEQLKKAVVSSKKVLHETSVKKLKKIAKDTKDSSSIFVLGKGQSYPAALEIALKIKEISYIHAEGFPSGELKHGVIALIEKGTPCIVLAPDDETKSDILTAAMEVQARGGRIIGLSPQNESIFDDYVPVDDAGTASIIPNIVVGQILAYYLALFKDLDPDMPRNLAKSVTVK